MLALLTIVRDGEALAQLAGVTKVLNDLSCVAFADLSSTDNAFVTIVQRRLTADWPGLFNTRRGHILDLAQSGSCQWTGEGNGEDKKKIRIRRTQGP